MKGGWSILGKKANSTMKEADIPSRCTSPTEGMSSSHSSSSCNMATTPPSSSNIIPSDHHQEETISSEVYDLDDNFKIITTSSTKYSSCDSNTSSGRSHGRSKSEGDEVDYDFYNFIIQGKVGLSPEGARQALTTTDIRDINQARVMEEYNRVVVTPNRAKLEEEASSESKTIGVEYDDMNITASSVKAMYNCDRGRNTSCDVSNGEINQYAANNDSHNSSSSRGCNGGGSSDSSVGVNTFFPFASCWLTSNGDSNNNSAQSNHHVDNITATYSFLRAIASPSAYSLSNSMPGSTGSNTSSDEKIRETQSSSSRLSIEAPLFKTIGLMLGIDEEEKVRSDSAQGDGNDQHYSRRKDKLGKQIKLLQLLAFWALIAVVIVRIAHDVYQYRTISQAPSSPIAPAKKPSILDQLVKKLTRSDNSDANSDITDGHKKDNGPSSLSTQKHVQPHIEVKKKSEERKDITADIFPSSFPSKMLPSVDNINGQQLKEQQLKEQQLKEQQKKEQQLKEQQQKEQQKKEQQLKEQQKKEQQLKEQQKKEEQLKEQQQKEQQKKEQQLKEQQKKEQQLKEQQKKEQQLKEQQRKEQQQKEQQKKEQLKEQQKKEEQLKEQQKKEQQLKEQQKKEQLKEQQLKEQLKVQQLKEQQKKEQRLREQLLKEQHKSRHQIPSQKPFISPLNTIFNFSQPRQSNRRASVKSTDNKNLQEAAVEHVIVLYKLSRILITFTIYNAGRLLKYLDEKGVIDSMKKKCMLALNFIRSKGYEGFKYASEKSYQGAVYLKPIVKAKSIEAGKFGMRVSKKAAQKAIDALPGLISFSIQTGGDMYEQATKFVEFVRKEIHTHAERRRQEREQRNARNRLK